MVLELSKFEGNTESILMIEPIVHEICDFYTNYAITILGRANIF